MRVHTHVPDAEEPQNHGRDLEKADQVDPGLDSILGHQFLPLLVDFFHFGIVALFLEICTLVLEDFEFRTKHAHFESLELHSESKWEQGQ